MKARRIPAEQAAACDNMPALPLPLLPPLLISLSFFPLRADLLPLSPYPSVVMAEDTGTIYFNKSSAEYSFLSNMYHAPFVVENVEYKTTEHFFQAAKARHFKDNDTLRKILDCDDLVKVKSLGKQVKYFDREEWDARTL